jgi:hypothetical protein
MRHLIGAALALAFSAAVPPARAAEDGARPFDPAVVAAEMWTERLGLTGDQAARLAAASKAKEEAAAPLRAQLRADLRRIRSQIAAKSADKDIQAALDRIALTNRSLRDEDEKFEAALAAFLSPTQRAKILFGTPLAGLRKTETAGATGINDMPADGDGEPE